jgi:hypothetical protein
MSNATLMLSTTQAVFNSFFIRVSMTDMLPPDPVVKG